jgi:hypothetical protein
MKRRGIIVIVGVIGLVILGAVGWYLASPLFINRTVDEEFPVASPPTEESAEALPTEEPTETLQEQVEATQEEAAPTATMPNTEMDEPMPEGGEPVALASGMFVGVDDFHQGMGTATLYELPDGGLVLRFDEFEVTNGPDLHVFLSSNPAPTGAEDMGEDSLDLGALKGNIGSQNYDIAPGTDVGRYQSVLIYCVPFHVVFATATFE